MLSPKRVKWRKRHTGRIKGRAHRGASIFHGEFGLMALERGRITARQIEAARVTMSRFTKRGGQIWIRIFPDKPVTKKPAETRMGKGKGNVEEWVSIVRPGRILYEMGGIPRDEAVSALKLANYKLPLRCKPVVKAEMEAQKGAK